jgi:hypothetical protein
VCDEQKRGTTLIKITRDDPGYLGIPVCLFHSYTVPGLKGPCGINQLAPGASSPKKRIFVSFRSLLVYKENAYKRSPGFNKQLKTLWEKR